MKTAMILGTTGLIGSKLTTILLDDPYYSKVKVLVRKVTSLEHPKLEQILFDYDHPDSGLLIADDVFCCLGTTMKKAGSKAAFIKVDKAFVVETAVSLFKNGAKKIAVVSSIGANLLSGNFYTRIKGEVEEEIKKIGFETVLIFRPSILMGKRNEFRFGELIGKGMVTILSFVIPLKYKGIDASKVAMSMFLKMQEDKTGVSTFESDELR
jgi:uncharacterized protein YbjT (DUF2867 family)